MALKNEANNYLRIVSYLNNHIHIEIYRNELSRRESVDAFERIELESVYIDNLTQLLKVPSNPDKSIYDNLITRLYEIIKNTYSFNEWVDC